MEKIKNIITGILSVAMLFLSIQIGTAKHIPHIKSDNVVNAEGSVISDNAFFLQTDTIYWFSVEIAPLGDDEDHDDQLVNQMPAKPTPTGSCSPSLTGEVCSVQLDTRTVTNIPAFNALIARITSGPQPSIQEFLDTGASLTGPLGTPNYSRKNP